EIADVVLAGASAYEKDGTFTNYQQRVQRIRQAVLPPMAAKTDLEIFQELLDLFDLPKALRAQLVFKEIAEKVKGYQGMDYRGLGDLGMAKG
ncbi:MAG: molybdopterin-dependent oxidoreductase, partial [Calditrichaeota bacterium]|nr:molybdopterin-dependent oxidoreductase [Calditrichota bacterium]